MAIDATVAMVILGFNLGLTLMPFLLSWSLTLNVSTLFLVVANVVLSTPLNPLEFFASWGTSLLGTIQACVFMRSTINPSRMLTFWHYDSEHLYGHFRNQYFEIAARGAVATVYILEGILFIVGDIRTIAFLAIQISINIMILVSLVVYFQIIYGRPTVAQFYMAMIITACFADAGLIVVAATVGEEASGLMLTVFFGVHLFAAIVTLIVTAIYGSAYNRLRVQGHEHSGSERLYPIFHDRQLYAPSLWLYMPAWFRSSPQPIEYTDDGPAPHNPMDSEKVTYLGSENDDDSYASLYDLPTIESELGEMITPEQTENTINRISADSTYNPTPLPTAITPPPRRARPSPYRPTQLVRIVSRRDHRGQRGRRK